VLSRAARSRSVQRIGNSRLGRWSVATRRAHPFRWFAVDAAEGVAVEAVLWAAVNRMLGLLLGGIIVVFSILQLLLRLAQRRAISQRQQ